MTNLCSVSFEVNGQRVQSEVEPRTHLGDFLRDDARLTGTHLGCEHGVCGACTVLLDGQPVRSCITYAVSCEGRHVTTVEGYDGDEVMQRLRVAFNQHHALQCGYCTPGMLATARDIVLRLPDADEARIRLELSGNLCRCTGYMGIVAAIGDVLAQLRSEPHAGVEALRASTRQGRPEPPPRASAGGVKPMPMFIAPKAVRALPVGRADAVSAPAVVAAPAAGSQPTAATTSPLTAIPAADPTPDAAALRKGTRIEAGFDVPHPADRVWAFMVDLPAVAACLPGAQIESQEGDRLKGRIAVKFGPMSAAFAGAARLERNDEARAAVLRGAGKDTLSQSRAQGDIGYRIEAVEGGGTRVHVDMLYALQGPLAQFSRSGLVKDFVRRMVADFGAQVSHRMGQPAQPAGSTPAASTVSPPPALSPWRVIAQMLRDALARLFGRSG